MLWTTAGLAESAARQWRYFEKAAEVLKPFSITIHTVPAPAEVPSNVLVDPSNRSDIWSVRKAAEKVMPGRPGVLRIIGCPFERTDPPYYAQTESGTQDGATFVDFILLNARLVRPDQCTVIHEMLHAASRADGKPTKLIDRWVHDSDVTSIYSEGSSRTVLIPDYAQALSEAYFARKR